MPDDTTTNNTTDTGQTTATNADTGKTLLDTAGQAPPVLNPDLTFADGWIDRVVPEDLRGEECLKIIKDLPGLVSQHVNAQKLIGRNKVAVPTEKSKPEEWEAFYTAIGRPKKPDDYQLAIAEDMQELYPEERLTAVRRFCYVNGITQKQLDAYLKFDAEYTDQLLREHEEAERQEQLKARGEAKEALQEEFGAAYEARIESANRLIAEMFGPDEEAKMQFTQKFGNDPDFVRFASRAGAKLLEHRALTGERGGGGPVDIDGRLAALRATPGYYDYASKDMTDERRQQITNEIHELEKQKDAYLAQARG